MNFRLFISFCSFLFINNLICQSFYTDSLREIKFYFDQPDWKNFLLDSLYVLGDQQRILATIKIDGNQYDSVGIRYKGYSSVNITQIKNPFKCEIRLYN